jgi:zinc transporter
MSEEIDGLICAVVFDGTGRGREIGWDGIAAWKPDDGFLWVHLDFRDPGAVVWLRRNIADAQAVETLLATETRPRAVAVGDHLLVCLRGVNLNPESDPEDMVSVRIWMGPERIVTTRHRRIMAVTDARDEFARGAGPKNIGDFLAFIAASLVRRMGPTLAQLEDVVDTLEGDILESDHGERRKGTDSPELRRALGRVRRQAIELRRYLAPQRDAMNRLLAESVPWLTAGHKALLREVSDHITRYVEDLDALRDRGAVVQDELRNRISEDMNRTMYVLTVVASILLPLGFVTGLLGINVDGLPGAKDAPSAFWLVTGGLVFVAALQLWLFRRLRWL